MLKKRTLFALLGVFLFAAPAFAQQKTVTGKVTSEQGVALASVSVVIKGTNTGTATNNDGNYSIRVADGQVLPVPVHRDGSGRADRRHRERDQRPAATRRVDSRRGRRRRRLGQTTSQRELGTAQQTVRGRTSRRPSARISSTRCRAASPAST